MVTVFLSVFDSWRHSFSQTLNLETIFTKKTFMICTKGVSLWDRVSSICMPRLPQTEACLIMHFHGCDGIWQTRSPLKIRHISEQEKKSSVTSCSNQKQRKSLRESKNKRLQNGKKPKNTVCAVPG